MTLKPNQSSPHLLNKNNRKLKLRIRFPVMKKKVTATVTRKPHKNQQDKERRKRQAWKPERAKRKNRRAKRPKMKARWIGERDGRKLVGRNEAETKKGEVQQRENQRNTTRIITQKGLMKKQPWNVEMEDSKRNKNKRIWQTESGS